MVFVICPMPEDSKQAAQVINFMGWDKETLPSEKLLKLNRLFPQKERVHLNFSEMPEMCWTCTSFCRSSESRGLGLGVVPQTPPFQCRRHSRRTMQLQGPDGRIQKAETE
ncbi:hypothetical protein Y1Q_0023854 [Alligator mississippiensis]|uniref:Uncharacterized protein n=1 Tax=Alligator mississippiensis TaxID=8496 RepID=A0A151MKN6_ALLMI|nr:hypothetical protein Y1Q_0023854 [Alligator mississippiensis]